MKKRVLSAVLAMILWIGLMPHALAVSDVYSDVPEDHWSAESVYRATELGIFKGFGDGRFGRGQAITRAAFVTALVRLFGWETVSPATPTFTDVKTGAWYYAAVETAVANGAIPVSSKSFRPDEELKRGEMTAMLMRALGYTSLASTLADRTCVFKDVTTNRGFIILAYDMGIVSGMGDGTFAPNAPAMREQAAAILVRLYDRLMKENVQLTETGAAVTLRVDTPKAVEGEDLPTTPLEPAGALYDKLVALKESGQNMAEVVLVLQAGGVRNIVEQDTGVLTTDQVSAETVSEILSHDTVKTYYSKRYESAYCVYETGNNQRVTIWYQSAESLAVKLQLARMFGVIRYVLE